MIRDAMLLALAMAAVSLVIILASCSTPPQPMTGLRADYGPSPAGYTPGGSHTWRITP